MIGVELFCSKDTKEPAEEESHEVKKDVRRRVL